MWKVLRCGGPLRQQALWVLLSVQTDTSFCMEAGPGTFGALTWNCLLVTVFLAVLSHVCVLNVLGEVSCRFTGTCVSDV